MNKNKKPKKHVSFLSMFCNSFQFIVRALSQTILTIHTEIGERGLNGLRRNQRNEEK